MSSIKKKVAGFIRQLSNPGIPLDEGDEEPKSPTTGSFIQRYLNGEMKRIQPEILCSKSYKDLPEKKIALLKPKVLAAHTGPQGGLTSVNRSPRNGGEADLNGFGYLDEELLGRHQARLAQQEDLEEFMQNSNYNNTCTSPARKSSTTNSRKTSIEEDYNLVQEKNYQYLYSDFCESEGNGNHFKGLESVTIAGINDWNRPCDSAFGAATTLYERHPVTYEKAGEPIADAFAICARENNAILALADGVNWGERSCLAARCAIHGCMEYLNKTFFDENTIYSIKTTVDIFSLLLRSMFAAHNLILQEDAMHTTLCIAFICPLHDSDKYIMCTCNVGDSLAFVYSSKYGVREVTEGSHDIYSMRDMRDALGALGPVDGPNPELHNLTCAMTQVEAGDIVFLTSDGISDNFDPVVGKFAIAKENSKPEEVPPTRRKSSAYGLVEDSVPSYSNAGFTLPIVEAYQRHELMLLRMEDLLLNGVTTGDEPVESARGLCESLVDFSKKLTTAKRRILEDPELYLEENGSSRAEQKHRRRRQCEKLAMVPGKLDHASVVSYKVGFITSEANNSTSHFANQSTVSCSPKKCAHLSQHISAVFREERQVIKESFV